MLGGRMNKYLRLIFALIALTGLGACNAFTGAAAGAAGGALVGGPIGAGVGGLGGAVVGDAVD
jgi:hypothetical protein